MNLAKQIEKYIREEAEKLIERHHNYHNSLHKEHERLSKRVNDAPKKEIRTPDYWNIDKKFNPFYVRRRAKSIALSIALKIQNGEYAPNDPHIKEIDKPGGGKRQLTIYQIPDAAVSQLFYTRLLAKNRHRFSSFSYAYRNDRNVHFAIQDISVDIEQDARTFIAEFDFSDFFGSINHQSLFLQFSKNGFFISQEEISVIKAFLAKREKGIPQGTSISLFLANLVCWKLDNSLEKAGLKFARYADDTVIWSPDYAAICNALEIINAFSIEAGVSINAKKSDGISLLARDGSRSEIASKPDFNFLGYAISPTKVSIKAKSERRIKKQISYLLYRNLIQPIRTKPLRGLIIPSNNRDPAFLSAMLQVRRYLYGGLLHKEMAEYIRGRRSSILFKGAMSFYPLLNDEQQLRNLDGWLLSVIHRVLKKRCDLLLTHKYDLREAFPFSSPRDKLVIQCRRKLVNGKGLMEIPSFMLIYKALKKGLNEHGIERVMNPKSLQYDY
ncbi:reverse transcriptase domain-containing protein [Collimonas fungivorans]|uniref:Retron-type reverse transcriptase n=1 Tax=Collimonas fungivorans (strain Ter331) TaxID=1005048 RepID=G0A7T6_COLFT|nr:reverse transcriptase domain-containing protein [Collimonas fungivorans]AEK59847.1 Retron-type reverse transcriptase [Collimonas fungivorans Ter331]